jgi:hypothetical protein
MPRAPPLVRGLRHGALVPLYRTLLRAAACGSVFALALDHAPDARGDSPPPDRAMPDYDGRGDAPTTPGDVAMWVPRLVVSPIYLVTEYGIRLPLGALVSAAERAGVPSTLYDFFTFGPDHKAGIVPMLLIEFGFLPSVGVYAFWDDFIEGNDLGLNAATWGPDWIAGSLTEKVHVTKKDTLTFHLSAVRRPDHAFFGIGPNTLQSNISRYGEVAIDGGALFNARLWHSSHVEAGIGVKSVDLYDGDFEGEPSLTLEASRGAFPIPADFVSGYTAQYNHLAGALDTRRPRPAPGSGFRLELQGDQGNDVRSSPDSGWIRYGGAVGGFWDVNRRGRVLSVSLATSFVDSLGSGPIPFTELVALGGDGPMRGFFPGRLLGQSAISGTVRYTWPIWVWLDGTLEAATGNVFGDHLDDFKPSLLRLSGAIGIESISTPDNAFEFLVGVGTETFEHGGQVDSVRLLFGTNHGF